MTSHDEQIGHILALKRGDMPQQALAEAMRARGWKWSQATVWSVEKGERPLRLSEAVDVAAVLRMDIADFLMDPVLAGYGREFSDAHQEQLAAAKDITSGVLRYLKSEKRIQDLLHDAEQHEIDTSEAWISVAVTEPGTIEDAVEAGRQLFREEEQADATKKTAIQSQG